MARSTYTRERAKRYFRAPGDPLKELWTQTGVKQKPFIDEPLPYTTLRYLSKEYTPTGREGGLPPTSVNSTTFWEGALLDLPEYLQAYNKARSKFLDKVTARAQLGATIAEWRSSLDMITARSGQMFRAFRSFRRGRFRRGLNELGITAKPVHKSKRWNKPAEASSLWLEYWFGWSPLLADIYTAVETLQSPVPDTAVKASSRTTAVRRWDISINDGPYSLYWRRGYEIACIHKIQARVKVTNPNLFEANRLGLVNPVTIAWELVPFSFLVDWFIPVGNFLEGYTDTLGLDFSDNFDTRFLRGEADNYEARYQGWPFPAVKTEKASMAYVDRKVRPLPRPSLVLSLPNGLSVTRGATAVALLVSLFAPNKNHLGVNYAPNG